MPTGGISVIRSAKGTKSGTTISLRKLEPHLILSPGDPATQTGIEDADWKLYAGGTVVDFGITGPDGKIELKIVVGDKNELEVFGTKYKIDASARSLEPINQPKGQQQRLRMLGFHLGHGGTNKDGVDGNLGPKSDLAILNFQIDRNLVIDGVVGPKTQNELKSEISKLKT